MSDTTQFVFQLQKLSMKEKIFVAIFRFCSLKKRPTHQMFAILFALMHFFYSWVLRAAPSYFNSFPKIYSIIVCILFTCSNEQCGCQSSISISIFCRMLFCLQIPTIFSYFVIFCIVHAKTYTLPHQVNVMNFGCWDDGA